MKALHKIKDTLEALSEPNKQLLRDYLHLQHFSLEGRGTRLPDCHRGGSKAKYSGMQYSAMLQVLQACAGLDWARISCQAGACSSCVAYCTNMRSGRNSATQQISNGC